MKPRDKVSKQSLECRRLISHCYWWWKYWQSKIERLHGCKSAGLVWTCEEVVLHWTSTACHAQGSVWIGHVTKVLDDWNCNMVNRLDASALLFAPFYSPIFEPVLKKIVNIVTLQSVVKKRQIMVSVLLQSECFWLKCYQCKPWWWVILNRLISIKVQ